MLSALEGLNIAILKAMDKTKEVSLCLFLLLFFCIFFFSRQRLMSEEEAVQVELIQKTGH